MYFFKKIYLFFTIPLFFSGCQGELQQPNYEYVIQNPAETGTRFPNLYQDESGSVFMSWLLKIDEGMYSIQYSVLDGEGKWGRPLAMSISQDYFVNWADFPSVVGINGEILAGHWLRKISGGTYAYDVNISFSGENPRRWTDPVVPHSDGTPTEHGFVSLEPIDEETVLAIWLDGRNTDGRSHDDYSDMNHAMTLRSAEVSRSGEISRERVIDNTVCDCCQTDLVRTNDGYIAVYRNRTEGEIRDIYLSRYDLESGEWTVPAAVADDGWEIMACPVNGPRAAVNGEQIAVAWYTMANDQPRVKLTTSEDGGQTFSDPFEVAGNPSIGRVDVAAGPENTFYVSWMEQFEGNGYIKVSKLNGNGQLEEPLQVGMTASSRSSGFPRMASTDQGLLFAWTQTEPVYRIRTARVPFKINSELPG